MAASIQKLLFPEEIVYDLKNNTFRTDRVNVIFMLMAQLANNTEAKEKGQTNALACLSLSADRTGLEPATSAVTGRHSNQLNYRSNIIKELFLMCKLSCHFQFGLQI